MHTGKEPRIGQPITMWPAELRHWPTYRTTGPGHAVRPARAHALSPVMLLSFWPENVPAAGGEPPHIAAESAPPNEEERLRRVMMWRERLPGGCYNWPPLEVPDPRAAEEMRPSEPAELTPLGRKLLGLDAW